MEIGRRDVARSQRTLTLLKRRTCREHPKPHTTKCHFSEVPIVSDALERKVMSLSRF